MLFSRDNLNRSVGADIIRPLVIGPRYRHRKPLMRREDDILPYNYPKFAQLNNNLYLYQNIKGAEIQLLN